MWNTVTIQYSPLIEEEWDEHFKVNYLVSPSVCSDFMYVFFLVNLELSRKVFRVC